MVNEYRIYLEIIVGTDEAKKDGVWGNLQTQLTNAKAAGQIQAANMRTEIRQVEQSWSP